MKINKLCGNCEFYFDGICASNFYGKNVKKRDKACSGWGIDFSHYIDIGEILMIGKDLKEIKDVEKQIGRKYYGILYI